MQDLLMQLIKHDKISGLLCSMHEAYLVCRWTQLQALHLPFLTSIRGHSQCSPSTFCYGPLPWVSCLFWGGLSPEVGGLFWPDTDSSSSWVAAEITTMPWSQVTYRIISNIGATERNFSAERCFLLQQQIRCGQQVPKLEQCLTCVL